MGNEGELRGGKRRIAQLSPLGCRAGATFPGGQGEHKIARSQNGKINVWDRQNFLNVRLIVHLLQTYQGFYFVNKNHIYLIRIKCQHRHTHTTPATEREIHTLTHTHTPDV